MPTDLTVILVNKPGTLADATQALGRAGINIEGIAGSGDSGEGILHMLVTDGPTAADVLRGAGHTVPKAREVLLHPVDDEPGAGGAILRRIADAGVNVDLVYLTTKGDLVIGANDLDRARAALMSR